MRFKIFDSRLTGRYTLLLFVLTIMALGSLTWAAPPEYFGYYLGDAADGKHFMDKVMPFEDPLVVPERIRQFEYTNVLHMSLLPETGQELPVRSLKLAVSLGYKVILGGANRFTTHYDPNDLSQLDDDINQLAGYISGFDEHILAIYLIDEPYVSYPQLDLTVARQEALVAYVRAALLNGGTLGNVPPIDVPLMINYSRPDLGIATNLDIVATDWYCNYLGYMTEHAEFLTEVGWRIATIKSQMPGTPIILIGDSFDHIDEKLSRPTLAQQQWYYDYVSADPDIIGLLMFILPYAGTVPGSLIGTYEDPPSLELHSQWGAEVMAQYDTPVPDISDRFGGYAGGAYADQAALELVYVPTGGIAPKLSHDIDLGEADGDRLPIGPPIPPADPNTLSYGACLEFGKGMENATRVLAAADRPGEVSLWLLEGTKFRDAVNNGYSIAVGNSNGDEVNVYNIGGNWNFYLGDPLTSDPNMTAPGWFDTGVETGAGLWHNIRWIFDGTGVEVIIDTKRAWYNPGDWTGGFNHIRFDDGWNDGSCTDDQAYVDDLEVFFTEPVNCAEVWSFGLGMPADIDKNCWVNILDFSLLSTGWLTDYDVTN